MPRGDIPSRVYGSWRAGPDLQHGGNLTDTRIEKAFANDFFALHPGPCYVGLTAGRVVYGRRICVCPISTDSVYFNFLAALLGVVGKQTYPEEAEHIDQLGLPASVEDIRIWVRRGRDATAVISNRESLHESIYKDASDFD